MSDEILAPRTSHLAPIIGIRDSGVGGLTVAREIKKLLPHARLLYFADTIHVPYGDRTPSEVRHLALSISEFLIDKGAQLVVFACNTSSAYALQIAKKKFQIPLVGMIEPGARAALQVNQNNAPIGVLATHATVQSRMYARWIEGLNPNVKCFEESCPEFVPLVESNQTSTLAARKACEKHLIPLLKRGAKTIVLGCTHYPLLLPTLKEIAREYSANSSGEKIEFVDPAQAVAREVWCHFESQASTLRSARDVFYVSGARDGVENWIEKLLEEGNPQIEAGPIFTPPKTMTV